MRVLLYGGTPAAFYTGGLEHQRSRTEAALRGLGVEVVSPDAEQVDLVHLFGANPATWHVLRFWNRNAPLVVSPVVVLGRPRPPLVERALAVPKIFGTTTARMRREVVGSADAVVALHDGEADYIRRAYGVAADRIVLVGNGTDATSSCGGSDPPYVIAVGTVSMRKAQLDLVRAWRPTWPRLLVVGPLDARWAGSNEFVRTVQRRDNVEWLGPLPQQEVWDLQAGAAATLSASRSEGESLALIDSLRLGRPVLLAASPAARALADRYRGGALVYRGGAGLGRALEQLPRAVAPVRRPPSWEDVAARLVPVYERLLGRGTHPQPSATEPAATST